MFLLRRFVKGAWRQICYVSIVAKTRELDLVFVFGVSFSQRTETLCFDRMGCLRRFKEAEEDKRLRTVID